MPHSGFHRQDGNEDVVYCVTQSSDWDRAEPRLSVCRPTLTHYPVSRGSQLDNAIREPMTGPLLIAGANDTWDMVASGRKARTQASSRWTSPTNTKLAVIINPMNENTSTRAGCSSSAQTQGTITPEYLWPYPTKLRVRLKRTIPLDINI